MSETKIKGLKIDLDDDYIEIYNSYQINNKQKMIEIIEEALDKMDFCVIRRSAKEMAREWALTNRLYRWHIFKKKNKNCKLKRHISLIRKILSFLLGFQQINVAKIKKRLERKKMSDISLGTLYDVNKNLVQKNEIKLSEGVLNSKKEIVKNFVIKQNNYYYMLLCNDRKDYTVFHWNNICDDNGAMEIAKILVDECLVNRGEIRGIDVTKDKDAIEIWLLIDEEAYCYYFFPYDAAIIEV